MSTIRKTFRNAALASAACIALFAAGSAYSMGCGGSGSGAIAPGAPLPNKLFCADSNGNCTAPIPSQNSVVQTNLLCGASNNHACAEFPSGGSAPNTPTNVQALNALIPLNEEVSGPLAAFKTR